MFFVLVSSGVVWYISAQLEVKNFLIFYLSVVVQLHMTIVRLYMNSRALYRIFCGGGKLPTNILCVHTSLLNIAHFIAKWK